MLLRAASRSIGLQRAMIGARVARRQRCRRTPAADQPARGTPSAGRTTLRSLMRLALPVTLRR